MYLWITSRILCLVKVSARSFVRMSFKICACCGSFSLTSFFKAR